MLKTTQLCNIVRTTNGAEIKWFTGGSYNGDVWRLSLPIAPHDWPTRIRDAWAVLCGRAQAIVEE